MHRLLHFWVLRLGINLSRFGLHLALWCIYVVQLDTVFDRFIRAAKDCLFKSYFWVLVLTFAALDSALHARSLPLASMYRRAVEYLFWGENRPSEIGPGSVKTQKILTRKKIEVLERPPRRFLSAGNGPPTHEIFVFLRFYTASAVTGKTHVYGVPIHAGSATRRSDTKFVSLALKSTRITHVGKNPTVFVQSKFSLFSPVTKQR